MTKMKNLKLLFLFALCLPFVAGCSDGDDEAPYVEVSQSSFTDLDATATTLTLKITSNASWTVTSDASWCVPLKAGGEGTADVQLNIEHIVVKLTYSSNYQYISNQNYNPKQQASNKLGLL